MLNIRRLAVLIALATAGCNAAHASSAPWFTYDGGPPTYVMFGIDSLTMGSHGATLPTNSGGYRTQLYTNLTALGKTHFIFEGTQYISSSVFGLPLSQGYHEGHSGFGWVDGITPDFDWSAHFAGYWAALPAPADVIFLMGGENDFHNGYTPSQVAAHVTTTLGIIKATVPSTTQIILSETPASPDEASNIAALNALLPAVIASAVAGGQLIVGPIAQPGVTFAVDDIHPDAAGYVTIGNNSTATLAAYVH